MKVLKRLFVIAPMGLLGILSCLTVIIPFLYWAYTGRDYALGMMKYLEKLEDKI